MRTERKKPGDSELGHDLIPGPNVIFSEWRGIMDDSCFHAGLTVWTHLARQTAKRLERQIGRPQSEFNRDCLSQELLWQICRAMRRCGVRNHAGLATTVVRNRARDILRRARACGRTRNTVSLDAEDQQLFIDRRQPHSSRILALKRQLKSVLACLPEIQQLAVATACQGETAAATAMGVSRRQLRKVRSEVRVELERRGLREFLSTMNCRSEGWEINQWNEVS